MMLAGHFPKLHIDHDYWLKLPVKVDDGDFWWPGDYRVADSRGKGVVVHIANPYEDGVSHIFRPIVRVKMGRA